MRLAYLSGLAALAAMSAAGTATVESRPDSPTDTPRRKPRMRKYAAPIGPPQPMSRQHRRALERASAKAKIS